MKVKCEKCNYKFYPKLRERRLKQDLRELYIICPKCKDKTRVALTNKETRRLTKKINNKKENGNEEDQLKLKELTKELKFKMDLLNCKA